MSWSGNVKSNIRHGVSGLVDPRRPKQDGIDIDLFSGGQILNYEFRDMLQDGKIKALSGAIDKFTETGVILTDGTELPADLVIYGTGFAKNYDIFDKVIQEKLAIRKDACWFKVALLSFIFNPERWKGD